MEEKKKLKKLDFQTDMILLIEFRREYWDEWVKFAEKNGYVPEASDYHHA